MRKSDYPRDEHGYCMTDEMEAQAALTFLMDHILGEDWYIVAPMRNFQANPIIVNAIIDKYNKETEGFFSKIVRLFKESFNLGGK